MKKIKEFILKYWLFIFLAALVATLASIFLVNREVKEGKDQLLSISSPKIETIPTSISPNLKNLKNNFPDFDQKLPVFEVSGLSLSNQESLKIASDFGFNQVPNVTDSIYDWSTEFNDLSIYLEEGIINYGLNLLNHPELISGSPPSIEEAENQGREFLKKEGFLLPKEIEVELEETYYAKVIGSYFEATKEEDKEKTLTYIKFIYKLNNKKIKGLGLNDFSFFIGSDFKIARLDYSRMFKEIKSIDLYPLKNKEAIINSLQSKPRISYLKRQDHYSNEYLFLEEDVKTLKNLSFDNIELIYYKYSPLQTYLQPVFLITGTAQLENNEVVETGLYLPAIKDQYLLTP